MFIRVDLPAPFSPRSAWTSPSTSSKSTWSLASTPGNCLVIPRSSRTAVAAMSGDSLTGKAGPVARLSACCAVRPLEGGRGLDLAEDDLVLQRVDACDVGPRHLRADLAERDAAVLEVEDEVMTRRQRAGADRLDQ